MPALMIDGKTRNYDKGTSYESIVDEYQDTGKGEIALVQINGKLRELSKRADRDGVLTMVRTSQPAGYNTYSRTAVMMLVKTAADLSVQKSMSRSSFRWETVSSAVSTVTAGTSMTHSRRRSKPAWKHSGTAAYRSPSGHTRLTTRWSCSGGREWKTR